MSSLGKFLARLPVWLIAGLWFLCKALLVAWATLAIYYSNLPWAWLRLALAIAFAAFAIWALWLSRPRRMEQHSPCFFSAWSRGGSPFLPRTIASGGQRSR